MTLQTVLATAFDKDPDGFLAFSKVRAALGRGKPMRPDHFKRLLDKPVTQEFMASRGLTYVTHPDDKRMRGFVRKERWGQPEQDEFDVDQFPGPSREEVTRAQERSDREHREWHKKYDFLGRPRKRRDRNETPTYKPSYETDPVYDDDGNYLG